MQDFEVKGNEASMNINPEMFSLEIVYSAAYVFLDHAYFSFDGDPEENIKINIKAKKGEDIEKIAGEFQNELVNYAVYVQESKRNEDVRSAIVERALATNLQGEVKNIEDVEKLIENVGEKN